MAVDEFAAKPSISFVQLRELRKRKRFKRRHFRHRQRVYQRHMEKIRSDAWSGAGKRLDRPRIAEYSIHRLLKAQLPAASMLPLKFLNEL